MARWRGRCRLWASVATAAQRHRSISLTVKSASLEMKKDSILRIFLSCPWLLFSSFALSTSSSRLFLVSLSHKTAGQELQRSKISSTGCGVQHNDLKDLDRKSPAGSKSSGFEENSTGNVPSSRVASPARERPALHWGIMGYSSSSSDGLV
ncbi:hypothetical protein PGTUg99_007015 [Puccinia graminis f. sp. tritici]|uniref:Uncharacterized protein n=1 Tax=Puccinia graminis f. sp. tritici TaxID=56615 RepID=A0A5B0MHF3_PUCGR|nr:hypothetical protein PGTUg99_007015 [Puccinia graminis f. sp. tritici]